MALIDFTLSNARRFYSSMGNPLGWKGLKRYDGGCKENINSKLNCRVACCSVGLL